MARRVDLVHVVDVDGVRIRYLDTGNSGNDLPLVLLHGYAGGGDYFFPHPLRDLASNYRIIAPDLPGFGYSGRLREYHLSAYAGVITRFFEVLGLPEVYLLGHGMGGQVAIATAALESSRVNKLILVSSAGIPRGEEGLSHFLAIMGDSSLRHGALYPTYIRLKLRARAAKEASDLLPRDFVTGYLKSLKMPTLIIWGSRDRLVPLEHGALLTRHIAISRLVVIRGAGHMPFYQKPEEFTRLVLAFLRAPANSQASTEETEPERTGAANSGS